MPDETVPPPSRADETHRDIAIARMEIEAIHAWLARMPTRANLARAALGIIFCTAILTTLFGWWFLAR